MSFQTSDAQFETDVLKSDVPAIVDFWAPWCGPCRMLGPVIERVGQTLGDTAKVFKLNVDDNPVTAEKYQITGIPTVLVFKNGKISRTLVGVQPERVYYDAVKAA